MNCELNDPDHNTANIGKATLKSSGFAEEICSHSAFNEIPSFRARVKNSQRIKTNKWLNLDQICKWYVHKAEYVQEHKTNRILSN